MLKGHIVTALFALIGFESCALADVDSSGFQFSAYAGATDTTINPGNLALLGEIDSLNPNNHQQTRFTWGFGGAYRFMLPSATQKINPLHDIALGLDLLYFQTRQTGAVWQFQQPIYNNFTYQLPIKSLRLMADSEWTFRPLGSRLFPFIEGGIGFARNTAAYQDAPIPGFGGIGVQINSHTQYQFAYTLGGGIKVPLFENINLSFRYLYANLGHASTANLANLPLEAPLTTSLSTQTWLAGLTYLF